MSPITTHILDMTTGLPGAGISAVLGAKDPLSGLAGDR